MGKILVTDAVPWNNLSRGGDHLIHSGAAIEYLRTIRVGWQERNEELESNEKLRQIIPYALIQDGQTGEFLVCRRGKGQGEKRLHGKLYMGLGGHVEEADHGGTLGQTLIKALDRELHEEVGVNASDINFFNFQGFIVANSTPVERVHLGVLYYIGVDKENINLATEEAEQHDAKWVDIGEEYFSKMNGTNKELWWEFEGWTQVVLSEYFFLRKP